MLITLIGVPYKLMATIKLTFSVMLKVSDSGSVKLNGIEVVKLVMLLVMAQVGGPVATKEDICSAIPCA